jgi:2-dehydro-3-deoxygalactonokinase
VSDKGASRLKGEEFLAAFAEATSGWRERWPALRSLASGMVGSNVGWVEAPYVACPASVEDLAGALGEAPGEGPLIVPGAAQREGLPNVMRGEETQILGVLCLQPDAAARPGWRCPAPTRNGWMSRTAASPDSTPT